MKVNLAVCRTRVPGQCGNGQCRYLGMQDGKDWCHKLVPKEKQVIDEEVSMALAAIATARTSFFSSCEASVSGLPIGDNCPGVDNELSWFEWLFRD